MGWGRGGILNKGVREDFSAKGSFEKNLNEVRGQAMLLGREYSGSHAKALGLKSRAKSPVNLQHEYNLLCRDQIRVERDLKVPMWLCKLRQGRPG